MSVRRFVNVTILSILGSFGAPSASWAQDCKPVVSRQDKITRQQVDVWAQELWSTSFLSSVVNTSETGITATIGRYGSVNAINLELQRKEESATNAAFDAAYRGAKGSTFYFGFKDGEPVALVVTDVNNSANVKQGIFGAKGVTTVILSAIVPDRDLARLRDQLTSREISAVRLQLAGDIGIDRSVSDGNGKKMMERFRCFYRAIDDRKIDLSAAAPAAPALPPSNVDLATVAGRYEDKAKPGNHVQFGANGESVFVQDGAAQALRYSVQNDVVWFLAPEGKSFKAADGRLVKLVQGSLSGGTFVSTEGVRYERVAATLKPAATQLTIDQVIKMVEAKLPEDVIVASVTKSGLTHEATPEDLIRLRAAGASDAVIRAIMK